MSIFSDFSFRQLLDKRGNLNREDKEISDSDDSGLSQYGRPKRRVISPGKPSKEQKDDSSRDSSYDEEKTPEKLIAEKVDRRHKSDVEFERDREYYNQIKHTLLTSSKYRNTYVAIVKGKLVGHGDKELELIQKIYRKYGNIPMYVANPSAEKEVIDV